MVFQSLARRILRIDRFTVNTNDQLPAILPAEIYAESMVSVVWSNCSLAGRSDGLLLEHCLVDQITLWKKNDSHQHEFVVLRMVDGRSTSPNRPSVVNILSGRWMTPEWKIGDNHSSISLASSLCSTGNQGRRIPAEDRILVYSAGQKIPDTQGAHVLYTHAFRDPPNIVRFAAVVHVLHSCHPLYTNHKHQCYWWALLVFRLVVGPAANDLQAARGGTFALGNSKCKFSKGVTLENVFRLVTQEDIDLQAQDYREVLEEKEKRVGDWVELVGLEDRIRKAQVELHSTLAEIDRIRAKYEQVAGPSRSA